MAGESIFIGYRRDDTADVAGRIYDALARRFGRARIFKDVDNIGPGVDFGRYIGSVLPRCRVALILIGPNWLESKDDSGKRRLDDDHDWVRIEIETALETPGLLLVPVLVNGARMPRVDEVPNCLKPLLRRNSAVIRRDPDFHDDVERLATALRSTVRTGILDLTQIGSNRQSGSTTGSNWAIRGFAMLVLALALVAIVVGWSGWLTLQGDRTTEDEMANHDPPLLAPANGDHDTTKTGTPFTSQNENAAASETVQLAERRTAGAEVNTSTRSDVVSGPWAGIGGTWISSTPQPCPFVWWSDYYESGYIYLEIEVYEGNGVSLDLTNGRGNGIKGPVVRAARSAGGGFHFNYSGYGNQPGTWRYDGTTLSALSNGISCEFRRA